LKCALFLARLRIIAEFWLRRLISTRGFLDLLERLTIAPSRAKSPPFMYGMSTTQTLALARACVLLNWSKMVLFAFYDLETVSDFAFVPEFLAATSLLEPPEVCRTELKPFLTIFGTSMRASITKTQTLSLHVGENYRGKPKDQFRVS